MEHAIPNPSEKLASTGTIHCANWVRANTAVIITHGIGNQLPLETIDQFARGIVKQLVKHFDEEITLHHELVKKNSSDLWFDNVLRIRKTGSDFFIDAYEYYWANYTEDKASWSDINNWLQGVVKGAEKFYKKNTLIAKAYSGNSLFFNARSGTFNMRRYRFFLATVSLFLIAVDFFKTIFFKLISGIPLLGSFAASLLEKRADAGSHTLSNVLGDIIVYNVTDPKSKFYSIRRSILDGAVSAFRFLIERTNTDGSLFYPSVIICAHSLGTQVSYDAVNKLNLMVNQGLITTYTPDGRCKTDNHLHISEQLSGFVTFGCPLDKIVFFLRENVPDTEYIRQQMLDNYHCFKLKTLDFLPAKEENQTIHTGAELKRSLEKMKWRNYWDAKDYVSGSLDYYSGLTNIECGFKAGYFGFTHSYYWDCDGFFVDIINHYLLKK